MNVPIDLKWRIVDTLKHDRHATLPDACARVGLAAKIPNDTGTKSERILARLDGKSLREVAEIAERLGAAHGDFELEEAALAILEDDSPPLTEITRRDIARCLNSVELGGDIGLVEILSRVWPIEAMGDPFLYGRSLADDIRQHMIRNDDWTVEELFKKLGALTCSLKRFFRLSEAAMHPLVRRGP
jgi:hypothetical protein